MPAKTKKTKTKKAEILRNHAEELFQVGFLDNEENLEASKCSCWWCANKRMLLAKIKKELAEAQGEDGEGNESNESGKSDESGGGVALTPAQRQLRERYNMIRKQQAKLRRQQADTEMLIAGQARALRELFDSDERARETLRSLLPGTHWKLSTVNEPYAQFAEDCHLVFVPDSSYTFVTGLDVSVSLDDDIDAHFESDTETQSYSLIVGDGESLERLHKYWGISFGFSNLWASFSLDDEIQSHREMIDKLESFERAMQRFAEE